MRAMPKSFRREFHRDAPALWTLWLELAELYGTTDRVVIDTLDLCRREIVAGWPRRRYVSAVNQLVECGWLKLWQPKGGGYGDDHKRWSIIDREARSRVSLVGMIMTADGLAEGRRDRSAAELSAMRNGRAPPPRRDHARSAKAYLKWRQAQGELFPTAPEPKPAVRVIAKSVEQRQPEPRQRPKIEQRIARNRAVEVQRELAFA